MFSVLHTTRSTSLRKDESFTTATPNTSEREKDTVVCSREYALREGKAVGVGVGVEAISSSHNNSDWSSSREQMVLSRTTLSFVHTQNGYAYV